MKPGIRSAVLLWGSAFITAALLFCAGWLGHAGFYGLAAICGTFGLAGIIAFGGITFLLAGAI